MSASARVLKKASGRIATTGDAKLDARVRAYAGSDHYPAWLIQKAVTKFLEERGG